MSAVRELARLDDAALFELARLHLVEHLTRGAAHSLNNALTALAGMVDAGAISPAVEREVQRSIDVALFVLALAGAVFSIYLTFLEPFVIGASCVWCLTSAVVMGMLVWLTAPAGWLQAALPVSPAPARQKSA